jgi:hypothetical protein
MHESDPFYKYLMKPCNITKNDVEAVIASADHKHKFEGNNLTKFLFIKHMPKDYFLLVDANLKDGHHSIQTVFRIFPNTIKGTDIKNPVHVLQKIANDFGYTLQVGDHYSKFIFKETLKVPKSTGRFPSQLENDLGPYLRPVDYKQNSDDIALGSSMVTPKVGSSDYDSLDIQIAYLISLKKYLAYQHENDPSSGEVSGFRD